MLRGAKIFEELQLITKKAIQSGRSSVLDFIYPPACLFCAREIAPTHPAFCFECHDAFHPRVTDACPRCGAPVGPFTVQETGCAQCHQESFAFDRVIRLGIYENDMRIACLRAKSPGGSCLAHGLAQALINEKQTVFHELSIDLVAPIPEHWTRRFVHSYYAAEVLAQEMARQLQKPCRRHLIRKTRRTPKQATSSLLDRRTQQRGSFGVPYAATVANKKILLVDDILTTGSTASAAARALKGAGAASVIIAVIAVSPLQH